MSARADLVTVVRLACQVEDRTNAEQQALLRVADRVDYEHNLATVTNAQTQAQADWRPSRLYDEVQESRVLGEGDRPVVLKKRRGVWPRPGTGG